MPRNGSGTYTPPANSWNPAVDLTDIDTSDWNDTLDDLADALSGSLAANGETTWTGDQNAGGYKLEGLAAGTASGDALAYQQIGAQVQGYSALLTAIAALTPTDGNFMVGNGTTWVAESGATARQSLGLVIGTDVQAYDADLAAIAALTSAADKLPYATGAQTWALTTFTAAARSFVGQASLAASETAAGILEIATTAEVQGLTDTGRAVTPAGLAAVGFPEFFESLSASGGSFTSSTLPKCRAVLLVGEALSHNSGSNQYFRVAISDDDGATFGGALQVTDDYSASASVGFQCWVTGTGTAGLTKRTHSIAGQNNTAAAARLLNLTETGETGITNKLRFSWSGGSSDTGTVIIYVIR